MMATVLAVAIGLLLGAVAGFLHLKLCAVRASLIVKGRPMLGLLLFPIGLVPPAIAVIVAARISDVAGWAVVGGVLLARTLILRKRKEDVA